MDEIGARIVTHPAHLHVESGMTHMMQISSRDADVDRLTAHVVAVRCYAPAAGPQNGVGVRRTVGGDYLDRLGRLELTG